VDLTARFSSHLGLPSRRAVDANHAPRGRLQLAFGLGEGGNRVHGVTLNAIIALSAGVLIVVLLAIAFVVPTDDEPIDNSSRRTPSPPSPRRQVTIRRSGRTPGLRDARPRRATPEARTTPTLREPRPAWSGIKEASTVTRRKLSHDLLHLRAWRRRRGLPEGEAGLVVAAVALSVALGYLIAHI
jgi:hypothetical protein